MTSDADLEAIWRAFRRDPAELYKLVALFTASARLLFLADQRHRRADLDNRPKGLCAPAEDSAA